MFRDRSGCVCVEVVRKWLAYVVNVKPSVLRIWCLCVRLFVCVHAVVVAALFVDRVIRVPWWHHGDEQLKEIRAL